MRRHNPAFIPRNHKVEEALEAATAAHDFSVMERLLESCGRPTITQPFCRTSAAPAPSRGRYLTFCGT